MFHSLAQVFLFLVYIICIAQCLHIHRPHKHYNRRDVSTPSSIPVSPGPLPGSEAADLIEDVTSIQEGLSNLPHNIFDFLKEIDDRLHQQEALLGSLLAVFATASQIASSIPSPTSIVHLSTDTSSEPSTIALSETSSPSSSVTACRRGGAGPLVPCSSSLSDEDSSTDPTSIPSPLFSRITRTLTRTTSLQTVPAFQSQTVPFANTTSFEPSQPKASSSIPSLPTPTILGAASSNVSASEEYAPSEDSSTVIAGSSSGSSSGYTFKKSRQNNVAIYYGQTPSTKTGGLMEFCQSDNVDIVVLAFVTSFFSNGGFPSGSFGPSCKGSTPAQQLHAPGLQDCSDLAPEIVSCQELGKPVLVSLGGYYANVTFTSDNEAIQLAENLWNLFGAGRGLDVALRPFGPSIVIDGFDLDNESHNPTSYAVFAKALRTLFASDTSKKYYLSAAPQCPRPDASIPLNAMAMCDFVFVQFYNNSSCDLSSAGFADSFAAWSSDLYKRNNETKLYIGAAGFGGAGSGYVEGAALGHQVSLARQYYARNLGGLMLWDGTEALDNVDEYGNDYLVYAKGSLQ